MTEDHRDINIYQWQHKFITDSWEEKLDKIGFIDAEIKFSGFSSQGDGASFEADMDIDKLCSHLIYCEANMYKQAKELRAVAIACWNGSISDWCLNRNSSRYFHENTVSVDWSNDLNTEPAFVDSVFKRIDDLRRNLCQAVYSDMEDEYEFLTSDKRVNETLISNEYEFTANGDSYPKH